MHENFLRVVELIWRKPGVAWELLQVLVILRSWELDWVLEKGVDELDELRVFEVFFALRGE